MKINDLFERAKNNIEYFLKNYSNIPKFVIIDAIDTLNDDDAEILNNMAWENKNIHITMDIFDEDTQKELKSRIGGKILEYGNDEQRSAFQQKAINNGGISKKPIILFTEGDYYSLQEGWHRVIAAFKNHPNGFNMAAWIGD